MGTNITAAMGINSTMHPMVAAPTATTITMVITMGGAPTEQVIITMGEQVIITSKTTRARCSGGRGIYAVTK